MFGALQRLVLDAVVAISREPNLRSVGNVRARKGEGQATLPLAKVC